LAADYPDGPSYRQTAGTVLNNLAVILQRRQKVLQTLPLLEKAIDHARAALRLVPDNPQARRALVSQLANLAHSHFLLGDHDASARTAEQVSAEVPERHETHRLAAYYVARCGPVAAGDARLSADRRRELEQAYGDRAMRLLRKAVDKGYRDVRELSTGRAFRPLWDRADYQQLVAELKAKPK
jgi:tetratricopeptide (TPR) repeat protein